ncbi:MAG: hypothetical protein SNH94_03385 [Rikenellaceae bacterium]
MKKYIYILSCLAAFCTMSCSTDAETPAIDVKVSATTIEAGESIDFTIVASCEKVSIYTGDAGSEYLNSYQVVTEGYDLSTMENIILEKENFEAAEADIRTLMETYNASESKTFDVVLDIDSEIQEIYDNIVDRPWSSYMSVQYALYVQMGCDAYDVFTAVQELFTDNSTYLEPEGGFSTGVSLSSTDLVNYSYTHTYTEAGVYEATIVATNIGQKDYSAGGTYNLSRVIKVVLITVTEPTATE